MNRIILLILLVATLWPGPIAADDIWPQFRGPTGEGDSSVRGLPVTWSEQKHVQWKTPIHDRGWSSPVVWGDQIWLTTAGEDGHRLFAICVDLETGKIVHNKRLFEVNDPQFAHKFNSYASPTPVIEEGRVYITFGSPGTACLDTQTGRVLWERRDLKCNHFRGAGSSPILFEDKLILHFDGSDYQYVIALDKKTGETVWRTNRSIDFKDLGPDGKPMADGDFRKAYSTPLIKRFGGREIMISLGSKALYAYDPDNGRELWRVEERESHSGTTRPVVGHGMIFVCSGFPRGQLLAVRPGGSGTQADPEVVWSQSRSVPEKPSLLLVDDLIYMVDDGGIASCLEAESGEVVWQNRIGGNYSASPIYADGRLYFFNEEGKTTVIAPGREFKLIAENHLDDGFMASPAVVGKALILRTKTHLYRIEKAGP